MFDERLVFKMLRISGQQRVMSDICRRLGCVVYVNVIMYWIVHAPTLSTAQRGTDISRVAATMSSGKHVTMPAMYRLVVKPTVTAASILYQHQKQEQSRQSCCLNLYINPPASQLDWQGNWCPSHQVNCP